MLKLKLISEVRETKLPDFLAEDKQAIFYLTNHDDKRNFFITFVVYDLGTGELKYYKSFLPENYEIVNNSENNKIYKNFKRPHSVVNIERNNSFLCFMEDEEFFFKVDIENHELDVYTLNDLVPSENNYKRIVSTLYTSETDSDSFYLGAVNSSEKLHIFRANKNLNDVEFISEIDSNIFPPHVLRNINNKLFLSHEFKYSQYLFKNSGDVVSNDKLASIFEVAKIRAGSDIVTDKVYNKINEKYDIKCMNGKIMSIDLETNEINHYSTKGGSPAHFELSEDKKYLYTSSHNFLPLGNEVLYLEPAVIDKFRFNSTNKLEHVSSFKVPYGYRYTSHKVDKFNGQDYIVVFGEPNRLIFINADTMELMYYYDIGGPYLSDDGSLRTLVQSNSDVFSHLALGTIGDGRYVCFLKKNKISFWDMEKKEIVFEETSILECDNSNLFTSHLDII